MAHVSLLSGLFGLVGVPQCWDGGRFGFEMAVIRGDG